MTVTRETNETTSYLAIELQLRLSLHHTDFTKIKFLTQTHVIPPKFRDNSTKGEQNYAEKILEQSSGYLVKEGMA